MPDPAQVLKARFEGAVADIDGWLRGLLGGIERLTPDALSAYPRHAPAAGWRVTVEFAGQPRRADIIVGSAFPFRPAQIALVDRPPFLTWPHVERDGVLCLVPERTTFSPDDPVGGVANLLDEARKLVERVTMENVDEEFRAEVLSYWSNQSTYSGPSLLGLIDPVGPSRSIRAWMGKDAVVLADDDASVHEWLRRRFGNLPKRSLKTVPSVLLNLSKPLLPSEYPETASDVYALAERLNAVPLLEAATSEVPGQIPIALTMSTPHGPAVAGILITRPPRARGSDPLFRGVRPNGIRKEMVTRRYFAAHPAIKAQVERIDPPWIHGRDQDSRFQTLRKSTVAVLGCGSVGGPVAVALAQAGIGRLILADKDSLKASNIGRHPLGMPALNQAKVRALAARIQTDLPHVAVDAQVTWAETLLSARDAGLAQADLIVSAMGSWASESMLDEWHEATGRPVPIIYGWTEAHACAGHAVAITASGARYRDGLDETGLPALRVTEWPNGPTVRQEPACGAVFQPYGPVELGYVTNMVVELALDCLLGAITASTHRIWAARRSLLERSGGHWTPEWMSISPNGEDGGVMTERPWATPTAARVLAA